MPYQSEYDGQWYNDDGTPMVGDPGNSVNPSATASGMPDGRNPYTIAPQGYEWNPMVSQWQDAQPQAGPPAQAAAPSAADPVDTGAPAPPSGGGGTDPTNQYTYSDGDGNTSTFDPTGFQWPLFTAPKFQTPAPFSYDPFKAPTAEDAASDPGYGFARNEGIKALENSAAAKGTLRTGGTLKDILGWGDQFATQNYKGVYDRAANTYDINRSNAADAYSRNYGVTRDAFDRTYQGAKDEFAPKQIAATNTFQTLYSQWRDQLDALTRTATAGAGL